MPNRHRSKRSRGPNRQQTDSTGLSQPNNLPASIDSNSPMMEDDGYYPQAPPSSIPGLDQGLEGLTIHPDLDQTFPQQPQLPSNTCLQDGTQSFGAAPHQPDPFPGVLPLPTLHQSLNSLAGADGFMAQDNFGFNHSRSFSNTALAGSQENSPGSSHTLDENDPQDDDPPLLQQTDKKGKRRASQSVTDDTRAKKRPEVKENTERFVQEQKKRRLASPFDQKKKHQDMLDNFEETYTGVRSSSKTSQHTPPSQWPCQRSHYTDRH